MTADTSPPPRSSFIGIHTRTPDMKVLFISSGTSNAIGFPPGYVIDKTVGDFVAEDYQANDYMGMYDLREADGDADDSASAYTWWVNLRHVVGTPVLHRLTSFKLDNCVIFIASAFPEMPYLTNRELQVQVLDGNMQQLNATRKREAREARLSQQRHQHSSEQPVHYSHGRQAKAAIVLEHPDAACVETPETGRRTMGPLIVFVTGSISRILDADPSDLMQFPFMKLVAPEDLARVGRFFDKMESTADVQFETFSMLQRPHVIDGNVVASDEENKRVMVECLASAVPDG
ncbi:hypothetical protein IWW50_003307, partial [Coemansia erecta]